MTITFTIHSIFKRECNKSKRECRKSLKVDTEAEHKLREPLPKYRSLIIFFEKEAKRLLYQDKLDFNNIYSQHVARQEYKDCKLRHVQVSYDGFRTYERLHMRRKRIYVKLSQEMLNAGTMNMMI